MNVIYSYHCHPFPSSISSCISACLQTLQNLTMDFARSLTRMSQDMFMNIGLIQFLTLFDWIQIELISSLEHNLNSNSKIKFL